MKQQLSLLCLLALTTSTEAVPSISVTDFGLYQDTTLNTVIPSILTENLINSGRFNFYERERLDTILREQGLQTSGVVDPSTAVNLGKLSGIDYIVTGEIIDFGREVRSFSGYGVRTDTVFYRLEVSVRVLETQTGRVIFSRSERAEEKQNQGAGIRLIDTTIDSRLGRIVANRLTDALLASPVFQDSGKSGEAEASFTVTSEPANASVEIDGVFYGNAGNSFQVPEGLHQVRVSLPGFAVWDKKVMVRDGSSFHVPLVREADIRVEVDEKIKLDSPN